MKNNLSNKLHTAISDIFGSIKIDKYGDKLLFILALVFLTLTIFRLWGSKPMGKTEAPPVVFTLWRESDSEIDDFKPLDLKPLI